MSWCYQIDAKWSHKYWFPWVPTLPRWAPCWPHGLCYLGGLFPNWSPFYWYGCTLIPSWISNYIHYNVWDEITHPFSDFKGAAIEVWEWRSNFIQHFTEHVITYNADLSSIRPNWTYMDCILLEITENLQPEIMISKCQLFCSDHGELKLRL